MVSLIESIGGRTRIIMAYNDSTNESHAYGEVYLGKLLDKNDKVLEIIYWLKQRYGIKKIFTSMNYTTSEIWLNLDWSANHPGGRLFKGDEYIPIYIAEVYPSINVPDYFIKEKAKAMYLKGKLLLNGSSIEGKSQYNETKLIEAIKFFDEAIDIYPRCAEAFLEKGNALQAAEKYYEAVQCYDKAINIWPKYSEAWLQKGNAFFHLKKYDNAIQCYDEATNTISHWIAPLAMKFRALNAMGREDEANICMQMLFEESIDSEFLVW